MSITQRLRHYGLPIVVTGALFGLTGTLIGKPILHAFDHKLKQHILALSGPLAELPTGSARVDYGVMKLGSEYVDSSGALRDFRGATFKILPDLAGQNVILRVNNLTIPECVSLLTAHWPSTILGVHKYGQEGMYRTRLTMRPAITECLNHKAPDLSLSFLIQHKPAQPIPSGQ